MRKPVESTKRLRIVDLMALTAAPAIDMAIARLLGAEPFSPTEQLWKFLEASWAFLLPFP